MGNRSCAAIITDDSILMVRQTYKGNTFWTFPGGRIETNEEPLNCAIRETKEETGLDIEIIDQVCELYNETIKGPYFCYLGRIIGGKAELGSDPELSPDSQELKELRWFPIKEMGNHKEVKRVIEFLQR
jgi:8-oxo-dGTP diphosphatase